MFGLGSKWKARFNADSSCRICIAGGGISYSVVVLSVWYLDSQHCSQAVGINYPEYFSLRTWRQIFKLGWFDLAPFLPCRGKKKKQPDRAFLLRTRGPVCSPGSLSSWLENTCNHFASGRNNLVQVPAFLWQRGEGQCIRRWGGLACQREEQWYFSDSYQLICVKSSEIRVLPFQRLSSF